VGIGVQILWIKVAQMAPSLGKVGVNANYNLGADVDNG